MLARRDEPEVYATPTGPPTRGRLVAPAVALAVAVAAAAVIVLRLSDSGDDRATLRVGPGDSVPIVGSAPSGPPTVEMELQAGWQTLLAEGDKLIVGTRPLGQRDLLLAALARDDAAFFTFPADGAALVVGGDRLKAKYTTDASKATRTVTDGVETVQIGLDAIVRPGPALGLGPPKIMPAGVMVRLGDVPQSTRILAAYFGPRADAALAQQAEAMAATVRLRPVDAAAIPPPPPGSRPGFDSGVPPAGAELRPVVSFSVPGAAYTARAAGDCAEVVLDGSNQALAGGCSPGRPAGTDVQVAAAAFSPGSPPLAPPGQAFAPGRGPTPSAIIVLARLGPGARDVVALLVDGREIPAVVGEDGWALVAAGTRPFLLEVRDAGRRAIAQTPVS